jgi:hypothetical protein
MSNKEEMQYFDEVVERAKHILLTDGELYPMFYALTVTGKRLLIVTPWENDKQKEATVNYIRMLFITESVCEYYFMTEMWFTKVKKMEDRPKGFICDLPEKQEGIVVVSGQMKEGKIEKKLAFYQTIRKEDKIELNLIPCEIDGGTFTDLLSPRTDISQIERDLFKRILDEYSKRIGFEIKTEVINKNETQ